MRSSSATNGARVNTDDACTYSYNRDCKDETGKLGRCVTRAKNYIDSGPSAKIAAGLAGAVSLAGSDSGLWSIDGGKWQIASGLINHSKVTLHLHEEITSISYSEGFYVLNSTKGNHYICEVTVIAMPLDGLNISFPPSISISVRRLQHTFTTFVRGLLNPDFEVNEQSLEYLSLHPQSIKKQPTLFEEHFELVMEDDDEQRISGSDVASQSSEEGSDKDVNNLKNSKRVRFYEVKDECHADAFWNHVSLAKEDALSLEERVALQNQQVTRTTNNVKMGPGGLREMSFISKSSNKYRSDEPRDGKRRGIQSLGLKPDKSEFYNSGGRGGRGRDGRCKNRGSGRR